MLHSAKTVVVPDPTGLLKPAVQNFYDAIGSAIDRITVMSW